MHVGRCCLTACAKGSTENAGGPGKRGQSCLVDLECLDGRFEGVRRDHYRVNAGKAKMFFLLHSVEGLRTHWAVPQLENMS